MKIYFERLGPKLPRYYMQIMLKPITGDCVWKEARAEWESPE